MTEVSGRVIAEVQELIGRARAAEAERDALRTRLDGDPTGRGLLAILPT